MSTLSANQAARFTSFSDNSPKTRRAAYLVTNRVFWLTSTMTKPISLFGSGNLSAAVQHSVKNFLTSQAPLI